MSKRKVSSKDAILKVIEEDGPVALVTISNDAFTTWAVRGPDHFEQQQYWTQPDEKSARSFARRLLSVLIKTNPQAFPKKRGRQ